MKALIRIVRGLVGFAAAALSFQSLMHLGELCGYGELSFLYPLTLDLAAAASYATWVHEKNRQALVVTWALLAVSVVLNGEVHHIDAEHTGTSWLLVVLVAAVPPTVFGLIMHLAAPKTSELPCDSGGSSEPDELLERARTVLAVNPSAGRSVLARELDVSPHQARRLKAALASTNGSGQ
jgi:hypothetical protein